MAANHPTVEQIKQARSDAGLTMKAAAESIGVTLRTWQYWENGKYKMREQSWKLFNLLSDKK